MKIRQTISISSGNLEPNNPLRYISSNGFKNLYEKVRRTHDAVRGFINYLFDLEALDRLKDYEKNEPTVNLEP